MASAIITNQHFDFFSLAQTVAPLAATAHASLCETDLETVNIPKPARIPSDMIALQMYDAGCTEFAITSIARQTAETVAPKRNK